MFLNSILSEFSDYIEVGGNIKVPILGIRYDSRHVREGDLFFCIEGYAHDGHDHIEAAYKKGAVAVVVKHMPVSAKIPFVKVSDTRRAMAAISNIFFHKPSSRLNLTGITGTNGKTTTSYMLESIYLQAGIKTGVMGTINYRFQDIEVDAMHTTPESPELNRFLFEVADAGAESVIMEVSSHAIALSRIACLKFDTAIFTNITPEHLDFHNTFENYRTTKKDFFRNMGVGSKVVVNIDDPSGASIAERTAARVVTYSLSKGDIYPKNVSVTKDGISFTVKTPGGSFAINSGMTGDYNVYNILAAVAAAWANDIPVKAIQKGLSQMNCVPGRFEKVSDNQDFDVFVDYAHTDDALQKLLTSANKLKHKRIITVFGCGGDRDKQKRPRMGKVASEMSDYTVLTSDNPRDENPSKIIDGILAGVKGAHNNLHVISDRREAIFHAIGEAKKGDIVIIAGKGHEKTQLENGQYKAFDDIQTAKEAIEKVGG